MGHPEEILSSKYQSFESRSGIPRIPLISITMALILHFLLCEAGFCVWVRGKRSFSPATFGLLGKDRCIVHCMGLSRCAVVLVGMFPPWLASLFPLRAESIEGLQAFQIPIESRQFRCFLEYILLYG